MITFNDAICGSNGTADCLSNNPANLALTEVQSSGTAVSGGNDPLTCTLNNLGTVATCAPATFLAANSVYQLVLTTGITDGSNPGNALTAGATYSIYTRQTNADRPVVASATPGFTAANPTVMDTNVSVANNTLSVTFNEELLSDLPDAGNAATVVNPANYIVEDCYLANTGSFTNPQDTGVDEGCTNISDQITSVGWTAYDDNAPASSYTAVLSFKAGALAGYYHSYKVTVAATATPIDNLAATPVTAKEYLYTNENRLPSVDAARCRRAAARWSSPPGHHHHRGVADVRVDRRRRQPRRKWCGTTAPTTTSS